jgi:hypothetical protein
MLSLDGKVSDCSIILILSTKEPPGQSNFSVCGLSQSLVWVVGEPEMVRFHLCRLSVRGLEGRNRVRGRG